MPVRLGPGYAAVCRNALQPKIGGTISSRLTAILSYHVCGRVLLAIRFEFAESRRADCIDAATGDRFFHGDAGFQVRL